MFDTVEIVVKAGDGGDGAISFRREKFVPLGGPDGGDGGKGGDVILRSNPTVSTLLRFKHKQMYQAGRGTNGGTNRKHGKDGQPLVLDVPTGTVIKYRTEKGEQIIADLDQPGQQVVVANGGKGGFGNCHYTSSTNQAPKIAQKGEGGEQRNLLLEMRLIADVGVVGLPNAGKSSLLAIASAARPKIASYPFTTTEPVLGVVEVSRQMFILAEIPGLIEGAHLGRGLGHDFLRHVLRTKILIHLIDGSTSSLVEDMHQVNEELASFDNVLAEKPQLVAVNKIDLTDVREKIEEIKGAFENAGIEKVFFISAASGEGVTALMSAVLPLLDSLRRAEMAAQGKESLPVLRPQPKRKDMDVHKDGEVFVIEAPELERIVARTDMTNPERVWELERELRRLGVGRVLQKAGVKPGDRIRCGNFEWEW